MRRYAQVKWNTGWTAVAVAKLLIMVVVREAAVRMVIMVVAPRPGSKMEPMGRLPMVVMMIMAEMVMLLYAMQRRMRTWDGKTKDLH